MSCRDDPQAGVASNDTEMNTDDQVQHINQEQVSSVILREDTEIDVISALTKAHYKQFRT